MKRLNIIVFMLFISMVSVAYAEDAEEITLTTYYPAPHGDYDELVSNELLLNPHDSPSIASMATQGNMYYDLSEKQLKVCDGSDYVAAGAGVPAGAVMAFAMQVSPSGWLECNGNLVLKSTYSGLFAAIGYSYGGSGASFNLPDYRGRFLRAWDNGAGEDPDVATRTDAKGGIGLNSGVGSRQGDKFESHNHNFAHYRSNTQQIDKNTIVGSNYTRLTTNNETSISVESTGGAETRPKNIYVMYCIKT